MAKHKSFVSETIDLAEEVKDKLVNAAHDVDLKHLATEIVLHCLHHDGREPEGLADLVKNALHLREQEEGDAGGGAAEEDETHKHRRFGGVFQPGREKKE